MRPNALGQKAPVANPDPKQRETSRRRLLWVSNQHGPLRQRRAAYRHERLTVEQTEGVIATGWDF